MSKVKKSAIISSCGNYRYVLKRFWGEGKGYITFVMLNPSKADANADDATIRRCISYAKDWGFRGLYVVNLFAYRSTDPSNLLKVVDPVGPENDSFIQLYTEHNKTIVAWGNFPTDKFRVRLEKVLGILRFKELYCLGITKMGMPKHPVRLSRTVKVIRYE